MTSLTPSLLVGSLLFVVPPASVAQSSAPHPPALNHYIQRVADDDADRSSFTQQAQDDMHDWGRKVHGFGRQVKTTTQEGARSAHHDLDIAYSKAKLAADKLKTVGADGWHGAKTTYQQAKHDLADTWDRITH